LSATAIFGNELSLSLLVLVGGILSVYSRLLAFVSLIYLLPFKRVNNQVLFLLFFFTWELSPPASYHSFNFNSKIYCFAYSLCSIWISFGIWSISLVFLFDFFDFLTSDSDFNSNYFNFSSIESTSNPSLEVQAIS